MYKINIKKMVRGVLKSYYQGFQWWFLNCVLCFFPSLRFRIWCLKRMKMQFRGNAIFYEGFHIRCPHKIIIGDGVSIGPRVLLDGRCGLKIGRSVTIGYDAIIWTLNHNYNDINFSGKGAPVEIGDYAWICSRSIILPGVKIGEGAIIASNAVVTHDVEPYTVVAGIPAKPIGKREKKKYDYGYNPNKCVQHVS